MQSALDYSSVIAQLGGGRGRGVALLKENKVSIPNISELRFVNQGLQRKTERRERNKRNILRD